MKSFLDAGTGQAPCLQGMGPTGRSAAEIAKTLGHHPQRG